MPFRFTENELREIDQILNRYPDRRSGMLPLLHLAQEREGWISPGVVEEVARVLEVSSLHVSDVVSFYTMFHRRPLGRHLVSVCRTLSCHVLGGEEILRHLQSRLRLGDRETGTDPEGLFTLETVECLGDCGAAPVVMIDGTYHENMTVKRLEQELSKLETES